MPELNYTLNYTGEQIDERLSNANQTFTGVTNAAEMTLSGPLSFTSATAENRNLNSVNYATISYIDNCKSLQLKPDANDGIKLKDSSNADVVTLTIGSDSKGYLWASGSISISDTNGSAVYKSNGITTPSGTLSFPSQGGTIAITSNIPDISVKMDKTDAVGSGSFSLNKKPGATVGTKSVTIGDYNVASGASSFASGMDRVASGSYSHSEGRGSSKTLTGTLSTTTAYTAPVGTYTYVIQYSSVSDKAKGVSCASAKVKSGSTTYDVVYYKGKTNTPDLAVIGSDVEIPTGSVTVTLSYAASGEASHAEGYYTGTTGAHSHAEGYGSVATAESSHAEGYSALAIGDASHAEGYDSVAAGKYSHSEGYGCMASDTFSHAEGCQTKATENGAHAEGYRTESSGEYAHVEGQYTIANHRSQHVFGEYNNADTASGAASTKGDYIEIVGNGTGSNARSNARTLDWSGNEVLDGSLTVKSRSSTVTTTLSNNSITRKTLGVTNATLSFNNATSGTILTTGDLGSTVARMSDVGTKLYLHSFTLSDVVVNVRQDISVTPTRQTTFNSLNVHLITDKADFSGYFNYISCTIKFTLGTNPTMVFTKPGYAFYAGVLYLGCQFFTFDRSSGPTTLSYGFYEFEKALSSSDFTDTVTEL